jgi:crotonobetainyl-CoA:carnitine CoA-transferase CaiB-like acyl-CoA transferase
MSAEFRPRPPVQSDRPGALDSVRVLDFSRLFAGPLASMVLADLGANVIKVESPGGDEARHFGPPFLGGEGMNYVALNRGKRSVVLDLKDPEDQVKARRLALEADVVIENFRPGVTTRLGIDYELLRKDNPGLIYCSVTGFDPAGPYRDRPAFDLILQGMSGVMARQAVDGEPRIAVVTIADTFCASLATQAILAALYARERDGLGQLVQADLFQSALYAQAYRMVTRADDIELSAMGDVAPYGAVRAADGWFNLAVATDRTFLKLCDALNRADLAVDARFLSNPERVEHSEELNAALTRTFATAPVADWLDLLERRGVPCGPILEVEDLFTDPHLIATGGVVEIDHPQAGKIWTIGRPFAMARTPLRIGRPAPALGEHTAEVLGELGAPAGDDRGPAR